MKYVVVAIVVLFAMRLLVSRSKGPDNKSAAAKSVQRAVESSVRKIAIAAGGLLAAFVLILLVKHLTS